MLATVHINRDHAAEWRLMLAEIELPANATGAPITYMAGGKQYMAFPTGGGLMPEELIAVAL